MTVAAGGTAAGWSKRLRVPLLGAGAIGLAWGVWLGLSRMGAAPAILPRALPDHGALMVGGFLGTVISLERAVASGKRWPYLGPFLCALAVILHLAGRPDLGALSLLGGSLVMAAILTEVTWHDRALHHVVLTLAALGFVAGNALLVARRPLFEVAPLWLAYLVGTISAERLELNRLLPRTRLTRGTFIASFALLSAGAIASTVWRDPGMRLLGAGQLALCAWMLRYDLARRTIRQTGAVRFIAASLLSGYFWLGTGGLLALIYGHPVAGPHYDAVLHAVFVGFVFSMIFGHALVILPAVVGVRLDYHPRFYGHLALLHLSLLARILGDVFGHADLRRGGAWANAAALLLFLVSTLAAVRRSRR